VPALRSQQGGPSRGWVLFGLRGRISRRVYWLAFFFVRLVQAAIVTQILGGDQASYYQIASSVGVAILLGSIFVAVAVSVKRLHDVGYSGSSPAPCLSRLSISPSHLGRHPAGHAGAEPLRGCCGHPADMNR
jgi:uncharacterized membrane protein YhaH (DUF805 family)